MLNPGLYLWIFAHEQAAYEQDGWQKVGERRRACYALHGERYAEVLMWKERQATMCEAFDNLRAALVELWRLHPVTPWVLKVRDWLNRLLMWKAE